MSELGRNHLANRGAETIFSQGCRYRNSRFEGSCRERFDTKNEVDDFGAAHLAWLEEWSGGFCGVVVETHDIVAAPFAGEQFDDPRQRPIDHDVVDARAEATRPCSRRKLCEPVPEGLHGMITTIRYGFWQQSVGSRHDVRMRCSFGLGPRC